MIVVENLTKRFGDNYAVSGLTFEVKKGEIVGFLGPNGAGKTTTMRILTGYMPATEGSATVAGYDVFKEPMEVKKRIGYLPEHPPLYTDMLVRSYLKFVAEIKGVPGSKRDGEVDKVLSQCGLDHVSGRLIKNMSKGYRQRVGLAQALISDPEILILDEPTIGLDPKQIIEIRQIIKGLSGDRTIILSTHILPEVSMTCSRVLIINNGRLAFEDTIEHLNEVNHISVKLSKMPKDKGSELKSIEGVIGLDTKPENELEVKINPDLKDIVMEKIADKVVKSGWGLLELKPVARTLEEVFMKHTSGDMEQQSEDTPPAPDADGKDE